jgi:hypothetical protein
MEHLPIITLLPFFIEMLQYDWYSWIFRCEFYLCYIICCWKLLCHWLFTSDVVVEACASSGLSFIGIWNITTFSTWSAVAALHWKCTSVNAFIPQWNFKRMHSILIIIFKSHQNVIWLNFSLWILFVEFHWDVKHHFYNHVTTS